MKLIRTNSLTSRQASDVQALEATCRQYDGASLTFPLEIQGLTFLLYDEETLLSAFSNYFQDEEYCECTAFTHPEHRRNGLFTKLLHEFLKEAGEVNLIFPADDSCPDARRTLEAMKAELLSREFMMELKLPLKAKGTQKVETPKVEGLVFEPSVSCCQKDTLYTVRADGQEMGGFHLIFQKDFIYLYGLEICKSKRHKGYGTNAMRALLTCLSQLKGQEPRRLPTVLRLQVSGDNEPAMALYRKLGFRIRDTLSYYLY